MTPRSILLIWPPASSVHGPSLGLAAVAGYLRDCRPDCDIHVVDLNALVVRSALKSLPADSELSRTLRTRWTQADIVQDALARWAFGSQSPAGVGALPDWECHYLSLLFGRTLDDFISSINAVPDLIGLSVCDNGFVAALGLTRRLRAVLPTARIVWGGVSMSALQAPAVISAVPELDAVVAGEGEEPLVALVDALPGLPDDGPPGLWTRARPGAAVSPRQHYLISEPAFDLFDLSIYPALELPISIGRGCGWGKCAFCNENFATSEFQALNPDEAADWALEWQKRYRPVSFDLVDSAANSNREGFRRFAERLRSRGGLREWRCMLRTARLQWEDLSVAVDAGLRTVYFGVESLDNTVLRDMQKGESVAHHLRAFRMALELGLRVEGDLILFFPTDTPEAVDSGITLLRRYDHIFSRVDLSFSRFVPGLQSETWKAPDKYGISLHPWSLRLARHLPSEMSHKLVAWDPHWEFMHRSNESVLALAEAYLRLQRAASDIRTGPRVTRSAYRIENTIVLETYGHEDAVLDRVFLEGPQAEVWDALGEHATAAALARIIDAPAPTVEQMLAKLEDRGFVFRQGSTWFNLTFSVTRNNELALRNCAGRPDHPEALKSDRPAELGRLRVD